MPDLPVPEALVGKIKRLLLPDMALPVRMLPKDVGPIEALPPPNDYHFTPSQIASAYGLSELYAQGYRGAGMTLGVVGGTTIRHSDSQSMWQGLGILRSNATLHDTMEPQFIRDSEAALGVQLAGALAPEAALIYYQGPDSSDTSLVYTLNEAVGMAQAQVLSFSFSHAEVNTSIAVSHAHNQSALVAAALGITIVAASGDSKQVDTPSNSPYVTAVGGTIVSIDDLGTWIGEKSWVVGGCGRSRIFALPPFQSGVFGRGNRSVADVGLNTGYYWIKYLDNWMHGDGTSASTPVFAGLLTVANQYRKAHGKPALGYLNSLIYQNASARSAFRDITAMHPGSCAVGPGYDLATGLGSPKAMALATAIP